MTMHWRYLAYEKMTLHPETRAWIEAQLRYIGPIPMTDTEVALADIP